MAQVALVLSLTHFEDVSMGARLYWPWFNSCSKAKIWIREGLPLALVLATLVLAIVGGVGVALLAPPSRQALAWALVALSLVTQLVGLRMMWTLTWNLGVICAYLLESEETLAVMACMGVGSICAPWYIGRVLFQRYDFPKRAMIGLSAWGSDELLIPLGMPGWYMHELCLNWMRLCFFLLDTALHLIPSAMLLQHSAWAIRPAHVLYSGLLTLLWGCSLSLWYVVIDWELLWKGRLVFKRWGQCSLYEPAKVGYIYQFENSLIPQDRAFVKCCPGFLLIILISSLLTAFIAALPGAGEVFFVLGGGYFISEQALKASIVHFIAGGVVAGIVAFAKLLLHRLQC